MTDAELREWAVRHEYTLARLAQELGISRRMLHHYTAGEWPIPVVVELALRSLGNRERARRAARARWDRHEAKPP